MPLFALLSFASILFLVGLGRRDLWVDEPREAGIIAEMARSGDAVVPRLNGLPFLEKPPLYYWIASLGFTLLGENTYATRLPAALAAIGGVLLVYILGRKMGFSPLSSFVCALVLATSAEYWSLGRRCLTDMMLCLFIAAAMVCFFQATRSPKGRIPWAVGFTLSLACAVLTKGLVGLAIPLTALIVWLVVTKNFSFRPWLILSLGSVFCLIPAAIWILFLCRELGSKAVYQAVLANNFGRFTGGYAEHVSPFYYYFVKFPLQFLPWTLFIPMACVFHVREIRRHSRQNPSFFILMWFAVPFILLSISAGKRGLYLLPLYPAAALFVGQAVGAVLEDKETPTNWFRIPVGALVWIVILVPIGFICTYIYFKQPFTIWPLFSVFGFCLGIWAQCRLSRKDLKGFLVLLVPALLALYLTFDTAIAPIDNKRKSFEPLFRYCESLKSEGFQIGFVRPKERMSGAAVFYLGSRVQVLSDKEDMKRFLSSGSKTAAVANEEQMRNLSDIDILKNFRISHDTIVVTAHKVVNGKQDYVNRPHD